MTGASTHPGEQAATAPTRRPVIVALGNPRLDAAIVEAINAHRRLEVASQPRDLAALAADLADRLGEAVVITAALRGLGEEPGGADAALAQLARSAPLVILAPDPAADRWRDAPGAVLPATATGDEVARALVAVLTGTATPAAFTRPEPSAPPNLPSPPWRPATGPQATADIGGDAPAASGAERPGAIVAFVGAHGAGGAGASTLALNAAAAWSRLGRAALIDLDLDGPGLAGLAPLAPERNLNTLARGWPDAPAGRALALARELQPLERPLADLHLLAGLPHDEAAAAITPELVAGLVAALAARFAVVALDVGADLRRATPASRAHARAVQLADRVVLVGRGDRNGLRALRQAHRRLTTELGVTEERVEVVIGLHDRCLLAGPDELATAVGAPLAALIPFDRRHVLQAARQRAPLAVSRGGRGPAERAIAAYAEALAIRLGLLAPEAGWAGLAARLRRRGRGRLDPARTPARDEWPPDPTPVDRAVTTGRSARW